MSISSSQLRDRSRSSARTAGKTTLVKLHARLYAPSARRILVDDCDLGQIGMEAWALTPVGAFRTRSGGGCPYAKTWRWATWREPFDLGAGRRQPDGPAEPRSCVAMLHG